MEELVDGIDEENLTDYPCIPMKCAAIFFLWSPKFFETRFRAALHKKIRSATTSDGEEFLLLEDVIRAAFPGASDDTIYMMALESCSTLAWERRIMPLGSLQR